MKSIQVIAALSLLCQHGIAAAIDMLAERADVEARAPAFQSIEPEEIIARLGTTPEEYKSEERHPGMVYFCREGNWGPPCYVYSPEQGYYCQELNPELTGHVGSVFVEAGTICRFAKRPSGDQCMSTIIFAWPENRDGWTDLLEREDPASSGAFVGYESTHFMCAQCTTCGGSK